MSNVGWNEPTAPAAPTIAADNGDGTGTITNPDGTVVSLCTECTTDTFATLSGSTITLADGSTVDVPAGSTYNTATNTITTSDGQVVQLATDTDTFATFDATNNAIILADGTSVPVGGVDTAATLSGTVITFPDGQTIDVEPSQLYRTTEATPDTVANSTTANIGKSLEVDNLNWLLTNRTTTAGARGVRNADGLMGFQISKEGLGYQDGDTIQLKHNGGYGFVNFAASGGTVELPAGNQGQVFIMENVRTGAGDLILTSASNFTGVMRSDDNASNEILGTVSASIRLRVGEIVILTYQYNRWRVLSHNHANNHGQNWEEGDDGRVTGWGNSPYNPAAFPAFTTAFTHIIEDSTNGTFIAKGAIL